MLIFRNECMDGCPVMNTHCEWGFCECNSGTTKISGQCVDISKAKSKERPENFDPFVSCTETYVCRRLDINLICQKENISTPTGKCQCKQDMKWNAEAGECQLFLDVDCSEITYDTQPSNTIILAVKKAQADQDAGKIHVTGNVERTEYANESLSNSLLTRVDPMQATPDEIKEAFCRDIDSFSFEMEVVWIDLSFALIDIILDHAS